MKPFNEQPDKYDYKDELVDWLIWDLYQQRLNIMNERNKTYFSSSFYNENYENEFLKKTIDNGELFLNIGFASENARTAIDFDFKFIKILKSLGHTEEDENRNLICPYKVACENLTFSKDANFLQTTFYQDIYFYNLTFSKDAIFSGLTFIKDAYFERVGFENKVFFQSIKFKNTIKFENIELSGDKSSILFKIINCDYWGNKLIEPSENSKIEIINTVINGRIEFNNVKIGYIDFKGSDILGGGVLNRINFEAEPVNWQTAVFLKNEAIKRSNTIEALEYKAIEKEKYTTELKNKKDKSVKDCGEIFSLWISKISNDHGQNWIRAVCFTLISGFLFFSLSQISLKMNIIQVVLLLYPSFILNVYMYYFYLLILDVFYKEGKYNILIHLAFISILLIAIYSLIGGNLSCLFKDYFNYLIPTNFDLLEDIYKYPKIYDLIFFCIFYILGKISVGYGIFEIIQAFRKFNSKG